jgi:hypothetical protein
MKLNQLEKAFDLCFKAGVTPALASTSGVGKTTMCKIVGKNMGFEKTIILRPSMIADIGDLVGLPDFTVIVLEDGKEDKRTKFNAPDWLPTENEKALIVIDEINRTQKDVVMALFGLIETDDPKIGNYSLPSTCKVVATLNPPTDNYTVLDFKDSAFTSRLCFLKIVPNLKVFTDWGRQGNLSNEMMDFLNKNDKFFGLGEDFEVDDFFGSTESERGDHIKNNNRSKKKVNDLYVKAKELGTPKGILGECIRGIAGIEFTTAFLNFADNYQNVVTLDDILKTKDGHERFDYNAIASIAKVLDDLKIEVAEGKIKKKDLPNLVGFFGKIPLDTFKGFFEYAANQTIGKEKSVTNYTDFLNNLAEHKDLMNRLDYMVEVQKDEGEKSE